MMLFLSTPQRHTYSMVGFLKIPTIQSEDYIINIKIFIRFFLRGLNIYIDLLGVLKLS